MKKIFALLLSLTLIFVQPISMSVTAYAADPLTGTVEITGTTTFGEELTATYTAGNNTGTLSYQWVRGSADISLATSSLYTLVEADVGELISVKITSDVETGELTSAQTLAISKAEASPTTGITPVLSSKTDTQIIITAVAGYEYIIVVDGSATSTGTWQDSNIFSGLTSSTDYDNYQRVKETATNNASLESAKLDVTTDDAVLTGTVGITGTTTFGEILTATYTAGNNTGTLSYQWVRGSADISSATNQTYTLVEADIAEQISVKITSSIEDGTLTSAQTSAIAKAPASPITGITPVLTSKTDIQITLTAEAGYEYIVVADGTTISSGTWQDSNVLTSLTSSTDYDAYQRVKETSTHNASAESIKLDVTTNNSALTGSASISGTSTLGEELSATYTPGNNTGDISYQWVRGISDISSATSSTYTLVEADVGEQISVKITSSVETGTVTSSQTAVVAKADCATTTGVTPVLSSKTDIQVTLTATVGYEYIVVANGAATSTGTWQDSNILTGLTSSTEYDVYQRVKETATHKASAVSTKLDVTTNVAALSGTANITGTLVVGETLSAALASGNNSGTLSYQWMRENADITGANSNTYFLIADDIGKKISVKLTSSVETGTITSAQTTAVEKQDCSIPVGVTPVLSSKTGTTVTLTSQFEYEYMVVANDAAVTSGTWQSSNVFTGLSGSTAYDFYQRVKESGAQKPSAESAKLDVTTNLSSPLTGTASISGTTTYGHTLTASLSSTNNTGTLSYQWLRGSTNITSATGSSYVLTASDVGQQIKVSISSSEETGTISSGATAKVVKAASVPAKGISPILSAKTRHTVTLTTYSGYEYMVVKNGYSSSTGKWQDSSYFSGLSSGTSYDFYQRKKETSSNYASSISSKLDIKTYSSSSSSSTATPKPTASPTTTVTSMPTSTPTPVASASPTPTSTPIAVETQTTVTPQKIVEGTKEGTLIVEIKVSDLPEGTKSIRTTNNSIIEITSTDSVFLTVNQNDLKNGMLEIVTLDEEGVALGSVSMDMSENINTNTAKIANGMPLWLKIVLGILIVVVVFTGIYVIGLKRRGY